MQSKKGFTLVELAISLIIIGLVSGMGVTAIITTLAETRRNLEVEADLTRLNDSFTVAIYDNTTRTIPNSDAIKNLVPTSKQGSFLFKYNDNLTSDVCFMETSPCEVQICNDDTCALPKIINNVLYSIIELGPNKNFDSSVPSAESLCNVRINKFDKNNDDQIVFNTLRGVKNAIGCDKIGNTFYFLNKDLPIFFRNSFPEKGIMVSVSPVHGVTEYTWKACMATRSGVGNLTLRNGDMLGRFFGSEECDYIDTADTSITTSTPNVFIGKSSNANISIDRGVYRIRILVRYKEPSTGKLIGISQDFPFSLADKQ